MKENTTTNRLIGGILMVLHPELYDIGCNSLQKLHNFPEYVRNFQHLPGALQDWNVPFNALSVVSNRTTPWHRDTLGRKEWLELLVALGDYEDGRFELDGLNILFRYDPGCILATSGKLFRHGAHCDGERACLAYYMRDLVQERLGQPVVPWANIRMFDQMGN